MILRNSQHPITPDEFTAFEDLFSERLPASFKAFYLAHNGGYPNADEVEGDEYVFLISRFFSIKYGRLPIERLIQGMDTCPPKDQFVPFASDPGSSLFILLLDSENYGKIYLLGAERDETTKMKYVSKSFGDFIAGILERDGTEDSEE